jgi:hypothetical protein
LSKSDLEIFILDSRLISTASSRVLLLDIPTPALPAPHTLSKQYGLANIEALLGKAAINQHCNEFALSLQVCTM